MKVKSKQYAQALFELTEGKSESEVDALVLKFVESLKRNGDFKKSDDVMKDFVKIFNKENAIVEAEVVSARELDEGQVEKIKDFIGKKYEAKEVVLESKVDDNVLGGVVVRVGEEVTDFSVGGQLKSLKNYLSK